MLKSVKVPSSIEPLFAEAEARASKFFSSFESDPTKGTITIGGQRYVLVRAAALSVHFLEFIKALYPGLDDTESVHAASIVLFDMAHNIGMTDAKRFHEDTHVSDPIAKLSSGPIHFSHTGWAFVDILEESQPSPDENFFLLYDHPQSFEADSWLALKKRTSFCTCFMNSGYSSGWCQQSFGIPLIAREIMCRARGDAHCRFIMAQPGKIDAMITDYKSRNRSLFP